MTRRFGVALAVLLTTALHVPLSAKGLTTKIAISGASLRIPIEITDAAVLKPFQIWAGPGVRICYAGTCEEQTEGFIIDWMHGPVAERPAGLPHFDISFYTTGIDGTGLTLDYAVGYELDPSGEQGYVYLPGPGDRWYGMNVKAMQHDGLEGHWFLASRAWQAVIAEIVASPAR